MPGVLGEVWAGDAHWRIITRMILRRLPRESTWLETEHRRVQPLGQTEGRNQQQGGRRKTWSTGLRRRELSTVLTAREDRGSHLVTQAEKRSRLW